jgi:Kef-type K+ transport system membrane component KefB
MMTPFLMGFRIFLALGFSPFTSLTVGICMSITAEATSAEVLMELRKLKTKIGSLMMGAGIIDDIIGISLFVVVSYMFTMSFETREVALLISALVSFFAGIAVHKFIGRESHLISYLERGITLLIVPFFFISMGVYFSLQSLAPNIMILVVIVFVAIAGKIIGVLLTKPLTELSIKQLYLVGWGMNSRGAVGLAIAFVGFNIGLLDTGLYSGLVFMALFTTITFPFFLKMILRNNPGIMD